MCKAGAHTILVRHYTVVARTDLAYATGSVLYQGIQIRADCGGLPKDGPHHLTGSMEAFTGPKPTLWNLGRLASFSDAHCPTRRAPTLPLNPTGECLAPPASGCTDERMWQTRPINRHSLNLAATGAMLQQLTTLLQVMPGATNSFQEEARQKQPRPGTRRAPHVH